MGLEKNNSNATFLTVKRGQFAMVVTEGGTEITTTNPSTGQTKTKRYELFSSLSGILRKVSAFKGQFGESLKVTLEDEGEIFVVDMSIKSDYALDFLKRLPAIEYGSYVKLTPVVSEATDKEGNVIKNKEGKTVNNHYMSVKTVNEEGEEVKVNSVYSAENPLPNWEKVVHNGEEKIDKTAYINALKSNIKEVEVTNE